MSATRKIALVDGSVQDVNEYLLLWEDGYNYPILELSHLCVSGEEQCEKAPQLAMMEFTKIQT